MTNYVGLKCPVCGKTFTAEDDIVVCPQCGAPYHRDCYAKAGKCVYEDKHGTPDAWTPPRQHKEDGTQGRTKQCPRCGSFNSDQALFCEHCGQSLSSDRPEYPGVTPPPPSRTQNNAPYGGQGNNPPPPYGNYGQTGFPGSPPPYYPSVGIPNPNEPIDDIPVGDVARFVQSNSQYYLPIFMNLKKFGKNRFNFCAFLFPGAWMLYRKMYKVGSVVTAVMFGLYIASAWVSEHFLNPIYQSLFLQTGIAGDTLTPSNDQIEKLMGLIAKLPTYQLYLMMVPALVFFAQLILMFIFGFSGNRMYLKHCIGKIGAIRKETARPSESTVRMQEEGGVNISLAICLGICYLILSYIPSIFY
ncbi:RING finger protein [Caproicibacter sp.]|uniref:RING finger protein n=1 Tax=Caproicibacter sp. TaxID=2814884 RepID=UPI00398A2206